MVQATILSQAQVVLDQGRLAARSEPHHDLAVGEFAAGAGEHNVKSVSAIGSAGRQVDGQPSRSRTDVERRQSPGVALIEAGDAPREIRLRLLCTGAERSHG